MEYIYLTQESARGEKWEALQASRMAEEQIYTDRYTERKHEGSGYLKLKERLQKGDTVTVYRLGEFGRTAAEIRNELVWMKEHNVYVQIHQIPITKEVWGNKTRMQTVEQVLCELYDARAAEEQEKRDRREHKRRPGRKAGVAQPRRPLPQNIGALYQEWLNRQEKADDIIRRHGYKRSTFYAHMKRYEDENRR